MGVDAPSLVLDDVTFGYEPGDTILSSFSSSFHGGTMTAVAGRSGTGKSTLLYLLGLLVRPQSGRVIVNGTDVAGFSDRYRSSIRSSHIGFVFQDAVLDPSRSVVDNVIEGATYGSGSRALWRQSALALLGVFLPEIDSGRRAANLSGGQSQRVAFCRALVNDPVAILADEPTGNLDDETADHLVSSLRTEADRGRIVVVATHDTRIVGQCDEVISL